MLSGRDPIPPKELPKIPAGRSTFRYEREVNTCQRLFENPGKGSGTLSGNLIFRVLFILPRIYDLHIRIRLAFPGHRWGNDGGGNHPDWNTITGHSTRSFPGVFWQTGLYLGSFSTGTGSGPNLLSITTARTGWNSNRALCGLIWAWGRCGVTGCCREG